MGTTEYLSLLSKIFCRITIISVKTFWYYDDFVIALFYSHGWFSTILYRLNSNLRSKDPLWNVSRALSKWNCKMHDGSYQLTVNELLTLYVD